MKKILPIICGILIAAINFDAKAQTEEEMKNWMEYMTPGDIHKMIASWDGEWTGDINMWMSPDAPPSKTTGTVTNKMGLGGRYQIANYTGSFNGMPFEGMSILAYDNAKKAFESIWVDNMGTGVMHLQGKWDAATKTIILTGPMVDPMTGKEMKIKETFKIVDADTQIMSMYAPGPDGKEFKNMEITYKRKK